MLSQPNTWVTKARMAILLTMTGLLLSACGGTPPVKTYTIGVVNYVSVLEPVLEGFKTRMAELGYVVVTNLLKHCLI
jgi:uncharacterized lipoprotein YmbA